MYKRIVVPTDGSENARLAVKQALELAKLMNVPATALYVIDTSVYASIPPDALILDIASILRKDAKAALDYVKKEAAKKKVKLETVTREGSPSKEIVDFAKPDDLIVMGTKGRTGLARIFLGSVAENVVHHARCPVMIIRDAEKGK
ncbi:MAG: universal stress protein [Thermoplasmata archaeon HGW-Thermoplasmata-2]|nr:MAG: universal stress protein [Thermoplasmata archaeon HGW-Thermoplasmata-2]